MSEPETNNIPTAAITAQASPNLVSNKPPRWGWGFKGPFTGGVNIEMPYAGWFMCDGKRILIEKPSSMRMIIAVTKIVSFAMAIALLLGTISIYYMDREIDIVTGIFLSIGIFLLFTGFLSSIILRYMKQEDFFIFDRTSGNVRLPKKFRCPAYILPFSDLEFYASRLISQHGMNQYNTYLHPKTKPKDQRAKRMYHINFGTGIFNRETAEPYWAFLRRFMDKNQPIPKIHNITEQIALFERLNKTLDDIPLDEAEDEELMNIMYPD